MSPFISVVLLCLAVRNVYGESISRAAYPNPQVDVEGCGREGRKSWICDPNRVLESSEANQLDHLLGTAYNMTACPCSTQQCKETPGGYRIAVAIVQKMLISDMDKQNEYPNMDEVEKTLHRGKLFVYTLKTNWDLGRCAEDVIIFYSLADNVLYTMTGDVAKQKLNGKLVGEIAMKHRAYFGEGREIFMGLQKLVTDYIAIFRGSYKGLTYEEARPRYAAVVGRSTGSAIVPGMFTLVFVVTASALKTLW